MSELFEQGIRKVKEALFLKGATRDFSTVKETSYEWTPFGVIEGDMAKRIDVGDESIYAMLYKAPEGSKFKPHKHRVNETGVVLKGRILYKSMKGEVEVKESEPYFCPANEWHSVEFKEETTLMIQFHPAFEGDWQANFK